MSVPNDEELNNLDCINDYDLHSSNKKFIQIICNKLLPEPKSLPMATHYVSHTRLPGRIWLHGIRVIIDIEYSVIPDGRNTAYLNIINPFNYATIRTLSCSHKPVEQMVANLLEQLNKLVYHKVYGFMEPDAIELNNALIGLFKNNCSAIKIGSDTCCICYDECNSKTPCGHDVCMPCLSIIPVHAFEPESDDEESLFNPDEEGISCPMCRAFIPILPFDFEPNSK